MKKKILAYNRVEAPVLHMLEEQFDVSFFLSGQEDEPAFKEALQQAEGIIGLSLKVNDDLLQQAPQLKIVSNVSVGYDNLDIAAMSKRGVMATNTPGVLTDTVADAIFGLLIATARRIPELDHHVKSGRWTEPLTAELYGVDVHHKTLGIIGLGSIGEAIAKRAHFGFDMPILYHNRTRKPDAERTYQAKYCSLDELLQQADFVCLMTPLTAETTGLMGRREFQLMKKSAIFINGSRGKTVVEEELIEALRAGIIAAAGLDVFAVEPVAPDNPLLSMPQVVTLPHIGSSTYETELKMSELAAKNLIAGLNGKRPPNLINQEVYSE